MSPESLLEKLEALGSIKPKIIKKLRKQLDNPDKNITVNKILSFLVKNELLTKEEAISLKNEPEDVSQATDDLVAGVASSSKVIDEPEVFAEAEPDQEDLDPKGDDEPTMMFEPEVFDQPTIIAEPDLLADIDQPRDIQADPLVHAWEESSNDATTSSRRRLSFDGKLDSSDQWDTKWVYIGFGSLGLLLIAGTLLFFVLSFISAEDRFAAATKSFEDGTYGDAIKKFKEFLDKHPRHEDAPVAKVKYVHSLLRDTFKQDNWDETIVRARENLPSLVEDETVDMDLIRQDLAVMLPTSTLEIARRATKQNSKSNLIAELDKAKAARTLVDNPVYVPNSRRKQAAIAKILDDLQEEIAKGDGLIRKQDDFDSALKDIRKLRESQQTNQAFEVYNNLIRDYGDLRANADLLAEMRQVSQIEAKLVKSIDPDVEVSITTRPSPIESSVVLTSKIGQPIGSLAGQILPILAEGSVYGVDLGNGDIRWRKYVGYQTTNQPVLAAEGNVLISDQSQYDLVLANLSTGELVWRCEIGEDFADPRLEEESVLLTTRSGKLLRIDLASGDTLTATKIPQPTNVSMTPAKRGGLIFQPGSYSNLYVLSDKDLTCKNVYYLGHRPGSISVPPVIWNGFVLVAVNQSGVCDLHILKPNSETGELQLIQRIRPVTRGLVTNPLQRFGRFMLVISESGDLKILESNTAEENNPIRIFAQETFENRENLKTYLTTAGSQMWIGARGIMRYKVSRALVTFNRQKISESDDYFIGPIHKFGDTVIHVRKRDGSAMSSIAAANADSLQEIWRTDIGGPLAGSPTFVGDQIAAISAQGNLFSVAIGTQKDNVVEDKSKSSNIDQSLFFDSTIQLSETEFVCLGPPGSSEMLFVDSINGSSKLITLPKPADDAACRPISIAGDIIIPSKQGQVLRVDSKNGRIAGTPFLPAVKPGIAIEWRRPAAMPDSRLLIGADSNLFLIDASDKTILKKVGELKIDGELKTGIASLGKTAYACIQKADAQLLMAMTSNDDNLQLAATTNLDSFCVDGPWTIQQRILLRLANDTIVCFDDSLNLLWSQSIGPEKLAAHPSGSSNQIQMCFSNGRILVLNADSGEIESELELGQPIVHAPINTDSQSIFAGLDGTLHKVQVTQ